MRVKSLALVTGFLCLGAVATSCQKSAQTPLGAAQLFLGAVAKGDTEEIYRLLVPELQTLLQERAQLPANLVNDKPAFTPQELLATHLESSPQRLGKTELLSENDQQAKVALWDLTEKYQETLLLRRTKAGWRVDLPALRSATTAPPKSDAVQ